MKKQVLFYILFIILISLIFCGCTSNNNTGNNTKKTMIPKILFFTTADSNINNFENHISVTTFEQGNTIFVYSEFCNITNNFSIDYTVIQNSIIYDDAHYDLAVLSINNNQSHSWQFNTDNAWPAGNYTVKILIIDTTSQNNCSEVTVFKLLKIPKNPIANATVDNNEGIEPFTIQFHGSGYDPDGTIESYYWDFDDGQTSSEQNPIHTFINQGIYTVTYSVTDNDGLRGEDTLTIIVIENTYTLSPTDDIAVGTSNNGDPTPLYPFAEILYVQHEAPQDEERPGSTSTIYLKFDLPNIPSIASIKTATLRLYISAAPSSPIEVKVHQYSDITWTENSFPTQWITTPPYSSSSSDIATVSSREWYEWDVTTYIKDSLSAGEITLVLDSDPIPYAPVVMCHSKDYYHTNPHFPELVVIIE